MSSATSTAAGGPASGGGAAHPDVIVIGGGPAGMSCAIAARGLGLAVTLFEATALGGELNTLNDVGHMPGRPATTGPDLAADLMDEMSDAGVEVLYEQVGGIGRDGDVWVAGPDPVRAPWLVVATGAQVDLSGLAGADAAFGKGVSTCASCDAPLFKDQAVAVLGGGRDALREAETVGRYASDVTLVVAEDEQAGLRRAGLGRAAILPVRQVLGVVGKPVTGLRIRGVDGREAVLTVAGVFPTEPRRPRSHLSGLPGSSGEPVPVDASLVAGTRLLAIGDVRAGTSASVAGALGDGVAAAMAVANGLDRPLVP